MTQTENNKHKFTESSTGLTLSEIKDGVDFPHTGLLKGLLQTAKGNHTVKTGTGNANTDFAITRVSSTRITVKGGNYFRDNKLETISDSGDLDLGYTTSANAYHLLVINEAGAFAIRSPTGVDKVADTELNDVIVAVLTYTGAGVDMKIQYLTNDKSANSLSIAHNNAGSGASTVYTEVGEITGSGSGVNFKVTTGHLTIENDHADGDIVFKGSDSDGTADLTALTLDMSANGAAIFSGVVSSAGTVLTGGSVSNQANNRITTSTGSNNDLNAEANLTFDGSTNILAVTGSIHATTLETTGIITTSANNITAPNGSVSAVSIGAGTNGISNMGGYIQSHQLAADAANPQIGVANHLGASNIHGHVELIQALDPLNIIIPTKEHYYVGLDTQVDATHGNGQPITPTGATGEFGLLTVANETNRAAGNLTTHTYAADEVFGGNTFFIGIDKPEAHVGRTVSITNITAYGMYVLVGDSEAEDPSVYARRNRVNGGVWNSVHTTQMLPQKGNTRCVNMSRIVNGTSQFYNYTTMVGGDWDAILVKPRETITISALDLTAETPGTHQHDVFNEQGLWNFPSGGAGVVGMWFLKNVTSSAGFANVGNLGGAFVHIPVWLTGTAFVCVGTNSVMLPHSPPIGTQYSFLVKDGTTTVDRITLGGSEAHMASSAVGASGQDEFYELSALPAIAPLSIAAGNGKTFIYTEDRNWEVIG